MFLLYQYSSKKLRKVNIGKFSVKLLKIRQSISADKIASLYVVMKLKITQPPIGQVYLTNKHSLKEFDKRLLKRTLL